MGRQPSALLPGHLGHHSAVGLVRALAPGGVEMELPKVVDVRLSGSEGDYRLQLPEGSSRITPDEFVHLCHSCQRAEDPSRPDGGVAARLPLQTRMLHYLVAQVREDRDVLLPLRLRAAAGWLPSDVAQREWTALGWRCWGWYLDTEQLPLLSSHLAGWVTRRPRVLVTLWTAGDDPDKMRRVTEALREVGHAADETRQNRHVARERARRLDLPS